MWINLNEVWVILFDPCGLSPSASQVYEHVVEGYLGSKLLVDVLQGPGQAVLSEQAFERGERRLSHPPPAVALLARMRVAKLHIFSIR